ncbi:MAG: hypothetical protein JW840_04110 [Candidatus Thermoplasmatota archaeon]|nr:hypothetical protein [Candidatus Thermoplasmatota archaeon]
MSSIRVVLLLFAVILLSLTPLSYTSADEIGNPFSQTASPCIAMEPVGNLSGYVTDTYQNPLGNARIRIYFHGTYEENYSDTSGYYHVTNIPLCYCLKNATCSKSGYQSEWVMLSISENTTYDFILRPLNDSCYPLFNGTIGKHGIFISCVNVTFVIIGNVDAVYYRLDGGSWTHYVSAFMVCEDGPHVLDWYWIYQGNESAILTAPSFFIDWTPPSIQLSSKRIGLNRIKITATAFDAESGMEKVEFYIDDQLLGNITSAGPDYEWIWKTPDNNNHTIQVNAYDNAGNSAESTLVISFHDMVHTQHWFFLLVQRVFLC